jgi:hypothetical protein
MYYNLKGNKELGFDAFIAPDDFNRFIQPVDIYEVFKREYALDSKARYIYYYSDGNFPLTLTPTTAEYFRYGYTQGGVDVIVDVPIGGSAVTIFGETVSTKRWVVVYMESSATFQIVYYTVLNMVWVYCGRKVRDIRNHPQYGYTANKIKYIHMADINSLSGTAFERAFIHVPSLLGRLTIPESITAVLNNAFSYQTNITAISLPLTKNITVEYGASRAQ